MKVFSNLPLVERNQVVIVIDDQPISWNMTYNEMRHKTKFGEKIGKKLVKLDGDKKSLRELRDRMFEIHTKALKDLGAV